MVFRAAEHLLLPTLMQNLNMATFEVAALTVAEYQSCVSLIASTLIDTAPHARLLFDLCTNLDAISLGLPSSRLSTGSDQSGKST